jgi:hypothetical protein
MSPVLKWLLIFALSTVLGSASCLLLNLLLSLAFPHVAKDLWLAAALIGLGIGVLYGLEAATLSIYDLESFVGWVELIVDMTWSLLGTVTGLIVGNLVFLILGSTPSGGQSKNQGWIVYPSNGGILTTIGTVNRGGPGQHERMHLLQDRVFGPFFIPFYLIFYVFTALIQVAWTLTLGIVLWLCKVRDTPYFRPPQVSVVQGFFGWIYYATPFELWAYASGNP